MSESHAVELAVAGDDDFEEKVLKSPVPVLVDFGAAWCGPCRVLEPVVEAIAREHQGKLEVVKVDADEAAGVAARYRVRGLPTVIAFQGGTEINRHVGATSAKVLLDLLTPP
jgi:thioredoxin 1